LEFAPEAGFRPDARRLISPSGYEAYNSGVFGASKSTGVVEFLEEWLRVLTVRQADSTIDSLWMRLSDQEALHAALQSRSYECRFQVLSNEVWNATDALWTHLLKESKWDQIKVLHSKLLSDGLNVGEDLASHPGLRL
jgi:hypothetical protein